MSSRRSRRLARQLERPGHVPDRLIDESGIEAGLAGGGLELGLLARVGRHLERLLEEPRRLDERAERPRAIRRGSKRDAGLRGDGRTLRAVRLRLVGRDVVLGQDPRDALVVERFEVARRGDVQPSPVALCQRPVRDLPDQPLDEPVLALLGRPGIGFERQHLAPDEAAQPRGELVGRQAADGRQRHRP